MAPTISHQIAEWCTAQGHEGISAQMCVVSFGFDVEAIAAHILRRTLAPLPSMNSCISCIVLPDTSSNNNNNSKGGMLTRVASALASALHQDDVSDGGSSERVHLHVVEEGSSTRARCTYYQTGGVVVLSARTLCADLLHRRVSRELVGVVIVFLPQGYSYRSESNLSSMAFCAEILLRGGGTVLLPTSRSHPVFIILSDDPCTMRYLVQRRHIGKEPFLSKVHVDDIQLFPRFRLDVVRHFEQLAKERPLAVERVTVGTSKSVAALDALLSQVIKEVLAELQALETRLTSTTQSANKGNNRGGSNTASSYANTSPYNNDDPFAHMQPISRRPRLEQQPPRYVRKPWVSFSDATLIYFSRIREEDAVNVVDFSLEEDLQCALRAHEPIWPFAKLIESLLDVRRLRRALRRLSPFAWLFALETTLASRTRRYKRDATPAARTVGVQPPDAPWTLSKHFGSIVALAIHRIGRIEVRPNGTNSNNSNSGCGNVRESYRWVGDPQVVVEDVDLSGDDGDVVCVKPPLVLQTEEEEKPPPPPPPPQQQQQQQQHERLLLPRSDEADPCMEYANRVVQSWCRRVCRQSSKSSTTEPLLMVVVFGERALRRYVCRLTHSLEDFQTFELDSFIASYQLKHGANIRRRTEVSTSDKPTTENLRTWFLAGAVDDDDDDDDEEEEEQSESNEGKDIHCEGRRVPLSEEPGFIFSQGSHMQNNGKNNSNQTTTCTPGATSLHQLLLSQTPFVTLSDQEMPLPPQGQNQRANEKEEGCRHHTLLDVESVRSGIAHLSGFSNVGVTSLSPHVVVVDASSLRTSELIAMLKGTHELIAKPMRLLIVEQQLRFLRMLEMAQDVLSPQVLRQLQVQMLVEQLEEPLTVDRIVMEEREAFEGLAHAKATLTGTLLTSRDALRAVQNQLDSGVVSENHFGRVRRNISTLRKGREFNPGDYSDRHDKTLNTVSAPPLVVFDEREFRSLLPYALYCRGIDLVPLTLATADYVLSPEYALERKSVPDFIQSLFSGRIHTQLAALSRRYEHPMCLIEFDRSAPFRLSFAASAALNDAPNRAFSSSASSITTGGGGVGLFARAARLFTAFPRVHVLWSRDATQSAGILHTLKRTCAVVSVDPSAPSLTRATVDLHNSDATKEAAHLAARVLSCFPSITPSNAPRVMEICGSLAGLATIDETSLASVMGEEEAKKLYAFLHEDLVAAVN